MKTEKLKVIFNFLVIIALILVTTLATKVGDSNTLHDIAAVLLSIKHTV